MESWFEVWWSRSEMLGGCDQKSGSWRVELKSCCENLRKQTLWFTNRNNEGKKHYRALLGGSSVCHLMLQPSANTASAALCCTGSDSTGLVWWKGASSPYQIMLISLLWFLTKSRWKGERFWEGRWIKPPPKKCSLISFEFGGSFQELVGCQGELAIGTEYSRNTHKIWQKRLCMSLVIALLLSTNKLAAVLAGFTFRILRAAKRFCVLWLMKLILKKMGIFKILFSFHFQPPLMNTLETPF